MRVTRAAHLKCPATQTIQGVNSTIFPSHPISESPFEPTSLQKACKGTADWYQYGAGLPHGSNILGQKRFNGHDGDLKCRQQVSGNTLLPEEQLRILAVKAAANSGRYQTSTLTASNDSCRTRNRHKACFHPSRVRHKDFNKWG